MIIVVAVLFFYFLLLFCLAFLFCSAFVFVKDYFGTVIGFHKTSSMLVSFSYAKNIYMNMY